MKIFYPAAASAAAANNDNDAAYCSDGIETSNGMAGLVGFRSWASRSYWPTWPTPARGVRLRLYIYIEPLKSIYPNSTLAPLARQA